MYTVWPGEYWAASVATVVEKLDQLHAGGGGTVVVVVVVAGGGCGAAGAPLGAVAWVVVVVVAAVDDVVDKISGFVTGRLGAADLEA